jgi:osmoprotectant transport system permease protein
VSLRRLALGTLLALLVAAGCDSRRADVVIGSKSFTESVILGEALRLLVQDAGLTARHRRALGGTRLVYDALIAGDIDAYVEYTGTLSHEIFAATHPAGRTELERLLAADGVVLAGPVGFENNYALGMLESEAARLQVARISDLDSRPDLVLRFSNEFMDRADGWPGLRAAYGLPQRDVRGVQHDLAYRAIAAGDADLTDVYTTDAEIAYYRLRALEDDRGYFPRYEAVLLYRADLDDRVPGASGALRRLLGQVSAARMVDLNAAVKIEGNSEAEAAGEFLKEQVGDVSAGPTAGRVDRLLQRTREHLVLVVASLLAGIVVAIPLGVIAAQFPRLGQAVLGTVGIAQTIPALALLVFMVPLFGIGAGPALVALFVYALLPIVRNTHAGLAGISLPLREAAEALGLPAAARLLKIELPLALPTILAGIKTAAVINVGGATLGALVGAGGYGQPILTGIRLDDTALILEGAVPAAALAVLVQLLFELLERTVVPRGLRLPTGGGAVRPRAISETN